MGTEEPCVRRDSTANHGDLLSLQCYQCQGMGPHGPRVPYTGIHFKLPRDELGECGQSPSWQQLPKTTVDDAHPKPQPRLGPVCMKIAKLLGKQEVTTGIPFLTWTQ